MTKLPRRAVTVFDECELDYINALFTLGLAMREGSNLPIEVVQMVRHTNIDTVHVLAKKLFHASRVIGGKKDA
jgi:hypothetical protein